MQNTRGFARRSGRNTTIWVCLVGGWIASTAIAPGASALASTGENQAPADPQRAQTPLSAISGAPAPPARTTPPLAEVPTVQAAYEQARAQIEDGSFQAAVETLGGALEEPGGDRYEIHYLLALARKRTGQIEAARASAETAARLGHGNADVHYLLAQLYHQQGKIELAIPHYRSATLAAQRELTNLNVTLAWYHLGQTLAEAGYDLAAAGAFERFDAAVWQTHPEQRNAVEVAGLLAKNPHGMVPQRLQLLGGLGRSAETVQVVEWARQVWPDDVIVARWYAETLLSADEAERAFAFCRQRLQGPGGAEALLPIAVDAARAAGRLDEWIDEVAQQGAQGQNLEQATALARYLNRGGAPNQAIRLGQALLAQHPMADDLAWEVAAAQRATGDLRAALKTLISFVRNRPDLSDLPRQRLSAWMGWFESGADVTELAKELRSQPDADFATDFVLGVSALAAGQHALAKELLQSCLAARPDFPPAYLVQGEMLLTTYRWDAAKAHAEKVLEQQPELAPAYYVLAEAHAGLDENQSAEQAYRQAIKRRPTETAYKLALAEHYRRLGNLLGAQRYFQAALENEPGNGAALEGLIDCYLRSGKVELARAQLERINRDTVPQDTLRRVDTLMRFLPAPFGDEHLAELQSQFQQHPHDIATARLLAGGLYVSGRLDEACAVIEKARALQPDDYHFAILLANVHAMRGEFDEAIDLLQNLAERFPNRLMVLEPLALCCVYDFRFEEGRPVLRRLIELEEDEDQRSEYREKLRDSFLIFGEFDEALRLVEGWVKAEPENDRLLLHKVIVLIYADRNEEASALLEECLARNPNDLDWQDRYYRSARATQQYERVLKRIREWLDAEPSSAVYTEWLIDVLIWADRADEALEVARKFEGTYVESVNRRIWLGRCHAAKGEVVKALAEFDALLSERLTEGSQRREIWKQIAITLLAAERFDEALQRCDQWLEQTEDLDPAFRAVALHWKRRALQAAGRDRESADVMEALLEYVPAIAVLLEEPDYNEGLFNDLGYVWVDAGMNLERATELIRRAVAADPWNAAFIDSLGWTYYKAGDFSNARKYLARAARLRDGQDPVVYDHLADTAYRLGDRDAAARYWNQAISLVEAETLDQGRARLADVAAAVRAKLAALERSEEPVLAPTAAEQNKE